MNPSPITLPRGFKLKDDKDYLQLLDFEAKQNTWEVRASELEKAIVLRQQRVDNMGYGFDYIKEPLVVREPNDKQPFPSESSEILEGDKVDRDSCKYNIPMVSIIIPTCDRPGFLKEALQSVLSQTYKNFEIIVINDGGRDVSEIINSLGNNENIIYLSHEEKRGPSAARNTGLKQARGKYIAYLDDDDIYYPNHLETLVVFLERNNYKVAYTDSYQAFQTWITDRYVTIDKKIKYNFDFDRQKFLVFNYIHIISIVHKKELLDEVGLFDEGLETHEDWDLCIRLSEKYDFYHIKAATAEFRIRDDMSSATSIKRADFLRTFKLIHKRYSHLVMDSNIFEEQKKAEEALTREVEIKQLFSSSLEYGPLHHYRFAKEFVKDKKVLVLGSDKGYGGFILSEDAESVTCICKNEHNVREASSNYIKENLEFIKGSITDVPVKEEKIFDVILCFEALEQIEEHNELMKEVKRLIKDDGIFIVSSSNKYVSSDQPAYQKPLALKELSFDDFKSLLKKNFKNTLIYGQKVYPSSNIFPLFKSSVTTRDYTIERGDKAFLFVPHERKEARYLIAVSSDGHIKDIAGNSYLVDVSETLFKLKGNQIGSLEATIRDKDAHIGSLEATIRDKDAHIGSLEAAIRDKDAHIGNLERQREENYLYWQDHTRNLGLIIKDKDSNIGNLETILREKEVHLGILQTAIKDKDAHIGNLERQQDENFQSWQTHEKNLKTIIEEKEGHITNLENSISEKEAALNHVYNSHGWNALLVYYKLRNKIFPINSKRRKAAKFLWNFFGKINIKSVSFFLTKGNIRKSKFYIKNYGVMAFAKKVWWKLHSEKANIFYKPEIPKLNLPIIMEDEILPYEDATVSVVIPVFNGAKDLEILLPFLKNQKGLKDIEIIVVDSGSTDESVAIAEKNGAKIVRIPNEKFSHDYARNLGAEHSSGKYILFLTQDALPSSDTWFYEMLHALKYSNTVAVSCVEYPRMDADLFWRVSLWNHNKLLESDKGDRILSMPEVANYTNLRKNAQLADIACLIAKDVFLKYKFKTKYAEDLDLGIRLIKDGYKLTLISSTGVIHSHNRPAYHHLKRGYVDSLLLAQILPDFPLSSIHGNNLIRDVAFAYDVLTSLINDKLHEVSIPCDIGKVNDIIISGLKSGIAQGYPVSIKFIDNSYIDNEFRLFMQKICALYPTIKGDQPYDGCLIEAMLNYLGKITYEYMKIAYDSIDNDVFEDYKSLIFKAFAFQVGAHFAGSYLKFSSNENEKLRNIYDELSDGKSLWEEKHDRKTG